MALASVVIIGMGVLMLSSAAHAADHLVGDGSGWDSYVDYGSWVSGNAFVAGDLLTFNYGALHSVYQVSKADYESCTTSNALTSDSSGATKVVLSKPATTYYFICGVRSHCLSGMKLTVITDDGLSSPAGSSGSLTPSTPTSPTRKSKSNTASATINELGPIMAVVLGLGLVMC